MERLSERPWRCPSRNTRASVSRLAGALALGAGLALSGVASAQTYQRLIGTALEEDPRSIDSADNDLNHITSGIIRRIGPALVEDMYVCKIIGGNARVQWTTQIGGPAGDRGLCVRELRTTEHMLLGQSDTTPAGLNLTLTKLDPLGGVIWTRIYAGSPLIYTGWPHGGTVREMRVPAAGGDIGVATANPTLAPRTRAQFLRTDMNGNVLFNNTYFDLRFPDGGEHGFADWRDLVNNDIVTVGTITEREQPFPGGPFVDAQKILVTRLTPGGAVVWARTYSYDPPAGSGEVIRVQQGRGMDLRANGNEIIVSASLELIDAVGIRTDYVQYLRLDLAGNPLAYQIYKHLYVAPPSLRSVHSDGAGNALIHANISNALLPAVAPPLPSPVVPPVSPTGPAGLMLVDGPTGAPLWANSYSPLTVDSDRQPAVGSLPYRPGGALAGYMLLARKSLAHGYNLAPNDGDKLYLRTDPAGATTCLTEPMLIGPQPAGLRLGEVPFQWNNNEVATFWQFTVTRPNFLDTRYTCPGDYTADCVISFADLNEILAFFGIRYNFGDLNLTLANFGGGC